MKSLKLLSVTAAVGALFLTGCATEGQYNSGYNQQPVYSQTHPTYRQPYQTQPAQVYNNGYNNGYNQNQQVRYGTVYNVRQVPLAAPQTSGAGVGIGAVAGGVIGNQIGHGSGRAAATILGAVGGGVLGNEIEKRNYGQSPGLEIQVRIDQTGEMITVVQPDQGQNFRNGARIRLVQDNGRWVATY